MGSRLCKITVLKKYVNSVSKATFVIPIFKFFLFFKYPTKLEGSTELENIPITT